MQLDALPVNSNGKVDRRQLPEPKLEEPEEPEESERDLQAVHSDSSVRRACAERAPCAAASRCRQRWRPVEAFSVSLFLSSLTHS